MSVITIHDLTMAIKNSIDSSSRAMEEEEAYDLAHRVLNFFGYADRIIDNILEPEGIEIAETSNDTAKDYANVIEVRFTYEGRVRTIRGTVIGGVPRLVGLDAFSFDAPLCGDMMYLRYKDTPGVIGIVGNLLGSAGINIAQMTVSRSDKCAMMFLSVDSDIPADLVAKVAEEVGTKDVGFLNLVE